MSTRAIVKSVLSGDTLVVRPKDSPTSERILHLAGITAPRMGSAVRDDESFAYDAREFLRSRLVGKEIAFTVVHSPASGSGDFVTVQSAPPAAGQPPVNVIQKVLEAGWAKLRDAEKASEELQDAQAAAESAGRGVWSTEGENQRSVAYQMPGDAQAFIAQYKGKDVDAVVEQVRNGTEIRVRLILSPTEHQFINLVLAGAKSPRAGIQRDGEVSGAEPHGDEAKAFVEQRLLQRHIKVRLLSAPASLGAAAGPTPGGQLPAPAAGPSYIIGQALHPNGDIAVFLCQAGLAKVIDWHAGILAPVGGLTKFREAERAAKAQRLGIWKDAISASSGNGASSVSTGPSSNATTKGQTFDASVTRVWGADQLNIKDEAGKERRVQLASVRGPKGGDSKNLYWAEQGKEYLRKRLIGKPVHVLVDYIKPRDGEYDERECVTITYGAGNKNVSEQLIEAGLATVLRHRRDDEDRSTQYDALVQAENSAVAETRGLHSGKDVSLARIVDASENASRASQHLSSWKRTGKHSAVVDFVSSGHRFKLLLPKEKSKITFALAGIRAPRTARAGSGEKSEPYGAEALSFANRYMQRDVEITFDTTDKTGGFIGAMYVGGHNAAVELVRNGLASVHEYSAQSLPFGNELQAAEDAAKHARKGIWSNYSAEAVAETVEDRSSALPTNYLDVYVSSIRDSDPFGFSVQILEDSSVKALEKLMSDFSLHHRSQSNAAPSGFSPRAGDMVSAKYSEDNQWYRAKVRGANPKAQSATVQFIDYGNEETIAFKNLRPLDTKFRSLPAQAREARLSFVKLPARDSEYGRESWDLFAKMSMGKKLIANVDQKEGNTLHLRLIDPEDPNIADDPLACINADMVREGLATIDRKVKYLNAYPQLVTKLQQAREGAKADRLGMFAYGEVDDDDE